jgi:putative colanic acid biosynthesis UDP-glucose lipid carrier transferase
MKSNQSGMIKPYSSQFSFIARVIDSLLIVVAVFIVACINDIDISFPGNIWLAGIGGSLIFQLIAEFSSLYGSWRAGKLRTEIKQIISCWVLAFLFCLAITILFVDLSLPNVSEFMLQWFPIGLVVLISWRVTLRLFLRLIRRKGFNSRTAAIVGTGALAQVVANRLSKSEWTGYKIHGYFDDRQKDKALTDVCRRSAGFDDVECESIGSFDSLVEKAESGELDCVFIALPMRAELRISQLLDRLANSTATVYVVPDLFVFELMHARSLDLDGVPAVSLIGDPINGWNGSLKRAEDIILSTLILSLIALPMMLIAMAIKLTSKGPVFFKQLRYGMDGKSIHVWKFRSMSVMENGDDFVQATKGDARITPVGAFLRRTSLDELPQFINVLQGQMSIVGPRPHAVSHNEEFRGKIKGYMRRHKIKPGITGWAQVNGWRGETDTLEKMEKRVEHDIQYIQAWSLWWDLKIIFSTVFKGFINPNAY